MDKGEEAWGRCPQGCWEILGHPATLPGPDEDTRSGRLVWLGRLAAWGRVGSSGLQVGLSWELWAPQEDLGRWDPWCVKVQRSPACESVCLCCVCVGRAQLSGSVLEV